MTHLVPSKGISFFIHKTSVSEELAAEANAVLHNGEQKCVPGTTYGASVTIYHNELMTEVKHRFDDLQQAFAFLLEHFNKIPEELR